MNREDLADLIRANTANLNRRSEELHLQSYGQLLNLSNDLTDLRAEMSGLKADVATIKQSLDLSESVLLMRRQIETLQAEVAALKRSA